MEFAGVGITGCYRSPIVDDDGFGYHLLCLPAFVIVPRSTKLPRLISPSWAKEMHRRLNVLEHLLSIDSLRGEGLYLVIVVSGQSVAALFFACLEVEHAIGSNK